MALHALPVTLVAMAGLAAAVPQTVERQQIGDILNVKDGALLGVPGTTTNIPAGSMTWLSGLGPHNIFGNLNVYGSLIISQTSWIQKAIALPLSCSYVGHDLDNGNLYSAAGSLIQINDIGSTAGPTFDWHLNSIKNEGYMQFCGRGDTGGSKYQLYSDNDAYNTGLISFEQTVRNLGSAFVWRNAVVGADSAKNLYNNGAFRLINTVLHIVQNIYGKGCWQLGLGSVLFLEDGAGNYQNPGYGSSLPDQSILFQDPTAVLHIDSAVYSRNSNFGARLYGFASGNAIEFYESIQSYTYTGSSGVLTVSFTSSNFINIVLGPGYDSSLFAKARNPTVYNTLGYNAIFYSGSTPSQSLPAQCGITAPICKDLNKYPPDYNNPSGPSSKGPSSPSSHPSDNSPYTIIVTTTDTVTKTQNYDKVSTATITSTEVSSKTVTMTKNSVGSATETVTKTVVSTSGATETVTSTKVSASASTVTVSVPETITSTIISSASGKPRTVTRTISSTTTKDAQTVTSTIVSVEYSWMQTTTRTITTSAAGNAQTVTRTIVSTTNGPAQTVVSTVVSTTTAVPQTVTSTIYSFGYEDPSTVTSYITSTEAGKQQTVTDTITQKWPTTITKTSLKPYTTTITVGIPEKLDEVPATTTLIREVPSTFISTTLVPVTVTTIVTKASWKTRVVTTTPSSSSTRKH